MYTAVKGTFENGQVTLEEPAPTLEKTKVVVMFLPEEKESGSFNGIRKMGTLKSLGETKGKTYSIPDDFNDPIDDLKDYM